MQKGQIMKILVDTGTILDVLCKRPEHFDVSSKIWKCCEIGLTEGYISALSVPGIEYILRKEFDNIKAAQITKQITFIFKIIELKPSDLRDASEMYYSDLENAVQMCQAKRMKLDLIVAKKPVYFRDSKIPALKPEKILEEITGYALKDGTKAPSSPYHYGTASIKSSKTYSIDEMQLSFDDYLNGNVEEYNCG
jgi:predicted nucleic acid-binding protein